MFFHTHVYYAKKVNNNVDNIQVIGSIIPDLAITSIIQLDDLHKKKSILDFFYSISTHYPEYSSLLTGIQDHNTLDYLTHIAFKNAKGYAYATVTSDLVTLVSKAFAIEKKHAHVTAHNFIESAVELSVLNKNPDLTRFVKDSIGKTDIHRLANIFSSYFQIPENVLYDKLVLFFSFVIKYDLTYIDSWVSL